MKRSVVFLLTAMVCQSCGGTTGGDRITFDAYAAGPEDAANGTLSFDNGFGFHVVLTKALLHIGAVYLNQTVPSSGSQATSCFSSGIYVAQVLGSLDVDALSPEPQVFPVQGDGTALTAKAGELWLTGGDVNAADDATVILSTAGTASLAGTTYTFEADLTIGQNRYVPSKDPSYPSANPICKQRIVTPIAVDITPTAGGSLLIRVDPRGWFDAVDFSKLTLVADDPPLYRFIDGPTGPADIALYNGMRSRSGSYVFSWQ